MSDRLREAFADVRSAAMRSIEAPGVDAVRRTVRRRRLARASAASLAFTGVALASALALAQTGPVGGTSKTGHPTPSDSATLTPSETPSTTPSGWSDPVSPSPGGATHTGSAPAGGGVTCPASSLLNQTQVYTNADITVVWDDSGFPDCAGRPATMFWAVYTIDAAGNAHLYSSQKFLLGPLNRVVHATLDDPGGCGVAWYVVLGDQPVLNTIPARQVSGVAGGPEPYTSGDGSSRQSNWDVRPRCPSTSPSPYHTLPKPSPKPS